MCCFVIIHQTINFIFIYFHFGQTLIEKTIKIADGGIPAKIKNVFKNTKKYDTQ